MQSSGGIELFRSRDFFFSLASPLSLDTDPKAFERKLSPGLGHTCLYCQDLWVRMPETQDNARGKGMHSSLAIPTWAQTAKKAPTLMQFGKRAEGLLVLRYATCMHEPRERCIRSSLSIRGGIGSRTPMNTKI